MQTFHFITGLPRAGTTLLAALLAQNPRIDAGMTSPLGSLYGAVLAQVSATTEFGSVVDRACRIRLLRGLFDSYYAENGKEIVFDMNRAWSSKLNGLLELFPNAKAIVCVRNVAWVMDSIERIYRANPFENTKLFGPNMGRSNVYNRLEMLAQHDQLVGGAWAGVREAFYGEQAKSMLLIDYELLAQVPHKVMPLIYDFIGEPPFEHDFDNVQYDAPDFDLQLGTPGLHRVQPKVEFKARRTILPPDLFEKYSQLTFWNDPSGSAASVVAAQSIAKKAL